MNRTVIERLSILISLVLLVKCDDVGTFNVDDDEDFSSAELESSDFNEETFSKDGSIIDVPEEEEANLKCIVCRAVIEVMIFEIDKVDPRKRIEVTSTKSIQYSKSETYLAELMEDLCEFMDTFATIRQVIVQKTILKSMLRDGTVEDTSSFNPENLSPEQLNYFCLQVLEENDEIILQEFMKDVLAKNIDDIVCTETAKYCDDNDTTDYKDQAHDEL